ncbi:MAG: hypothetical protein ACOC8L_02810, partial [Spirochaetota bacterium]
MSNREAWMTQFEQTYTEQTTAWNTAYTHFAQRKQQWITESAALTVGASTEELAALAGRAQASIAAVASITPDDLGLPAVDAESAFSEVMAGTNLDGLLERLRLENKAIANINTEVFSQLQPDQYGPQEVARLVQRFQAVNDGSVRSHLAILQGRKILEQADALVVQFNKTIADANESQERGIDRMLGDAGFRRSGDHYTRRTL